VLISYADEGVNQGCPLASALFSLVQSMTLKDVLSQYVSVGVTRLSYVDDTHLHGPVEGVFAAFRDYARQMESIGCRLNLTKCLVHVPASRSQSADAARQKAKSLGLRYAEDGLIVLGSPVGTPTFESYHFEQAVKAMTQRVSSLLELLEDAEQPPGCSLQSVSYMLRVSSFSSLTHLLRTVPPAHTLAGAEEADNVLMEAVASLAGCPACVMDTHTRKRAQLPLDRGGMGIASQVELRHIAYLASLCAVTAGNTNLLPFLKQDGGVDSIVGLSDALQVVTAELPGLPDDDAIPSISEILASGKLGLQRRWSDFKANIRFDEVRRQLSGKKLLFLLSTATSEASAAYSAHPLIGVNQLRNIHLAMLYKVRLGIDLFHKEFKCKCGTVVTPDGLHALSCKLMHRFTTTRHHRVKHTVADVLKKCGGVSISKELPLTKVAGVVPKALVPSTLPKGSKSKDEGLIMDIVRSETHSDFVHLIDIVTAHPTENTNTTMQPGQAARAAEQRKRTLYNKRWFFSSKRQLVPFAIETGGTMGEDAIKFMKHVLGQNPLGDEEELALCDRPQYRRAIERVAVVNQRHVAVQLLQYVVYSRHDIERALHGDDHADNGAA
jgi:hypothetical protein